MNRWFAGRIEVPLSSRTRAANRFASSGRSCCLEVLLLGLLVLGVFVIEAVWLLRRRREITRRRLGQRSTRRLAQELGAFLRLLLVEGMTEAQHAGPHAVALVAELVGPQLGRGFDCLAGLDSLF